MIDRDELPKEISRLRRGVREILTEAGIDAPDLVEALAHGLAEYELTGNFVEWHRSLEFYEQPH